MVTQYAPVETRSAAGVAGRIVLTLLGAAGLIVGALLQWWNDIVGTEFTVEALYQNTFTTADRFLTSVGFVAIALGLLAVLGLAGSSGMLTRLAGALGVVMFILLAIQGYRVSSNSVEAELDQIDVGVWLALAGSLVALVGGFMGRPRLVSRPVTTAADDEI
jgi:hypothetical protein